MIEGVTKIPNIFGKNTEIANKMDYDDYVDPINRKKKEDVIFVTAAKKANKIELLIDEVEL